MTTPHNQSDESQQISLRLEQYDDIFSDFDLRPYSHRALSSDFLEEIKRASRDKSNEGIDLALYIPEAARNPAQEPVIIERLSAHFKKHYLMVKKEKRNVLGLGIGMVVLGVICMILATYVVFEDPSHSVGLSFLVVFLEPAAWFLLWEGMDQIIFTSKNVQPELDFYRKMSHAECNTHFESYDRIAHAE